MSPENKTKYEIINQTFQNAVSEVTIKSHKDRTCVKIECVNVEVPTSNKLLWTALHYLIGSTSIMEIHSFDKQGNTIDIEKYVLEGITMEIVGLFI